MTDTMTHRLHHIQALAALDHLGAVLFLLADLHSDDRCGGLDEALAFYNGARPERRIEPSGPATRLLPAASLTERDAAIAAIVDALKHVDDILHDGKSSQAVAVMEASLKIEAILSNLPERAKAMSAVVEAAKALVAADSPLRAAVEALPALKDKAP